MAFDIADVVRTLVARRQQALAELADGSDADGRLAPHLQEIQARLAELADRDDAPTRRGAVVPKRVPEDVTQARVDEIGAWCRGTHLEFREIVPSRMNRIMLAKGGLETDQVLEVGAPEGKAENRQSG